MSAKIIPLRGPRHVDHDPPRPSGYTPAVLQTLAAVDALLQQATAQLAAAGAEAGSEAALEISDAQRHLADARYFVNWREAGEAAGGAA